MTIYFHIGSCLLFLAFGKTVMAQENSKNCPTIELSAEVKDENKNDKKGEIKLSIRGGQSPYVISWTAFNFSKKGEHIKNLEAGYYSVIVVDANKCIKTSENIVVKNIIKIN